MFGSFWFGPSVNQIAAGTTSLVRDIHPPLRGDWRKFSASYAFQRRQQIMKTPILFALTLIGCAALFFFAPHHRRQPESFNACTLGEIFGDFFNGYDWMIPRKLGFFLACAFFAFTAAFY